MVGRDTGHAIPDRAASRLPAGPGVLVLIAVGAAMGTTVRSWLESAFAPGPGVWPWVTFWINVCGSFALGALLEALASTGPDKGWRRRARLGAGTGLLGGFTTYSTFSMEVVQLLRGGAGWIAAGYALFSVVTGIAAALLATRGTRMLVAATRPGGTS